MLAVPCGRTIDENIKYDLYYCPSRVRHKTRASFLGLYAGKSVRALGRIKKIVVCHSIDLKLRSFKFAAGWDEPNERERQRIVSAARGSVGDPKKADFFITNDVKYYPCDEMVETDFRKPLRVGCKTSGTFVLKKCWGRRFCRTVLRRSQRS